MERGAGVLAGAGGESGIWSGEVAEGGEGAEGVEGENLAGEAETVTVSLGVEETRELLQEVPASYHTQINDVLLTALAEVLGNGQERSGCG